MRIGGDDYMEELNADRIIEIHDRIIEKYGGTSGILY